MKIVQIVASLEARHGGPSVSVPALSAQLARIGHDVGLLATGPAPANPLEEPRLTVRVFHRDSPESVGRSSGLKQHVASCEADVLHSHGLWLRSLHYAHCRSRDRSPIHVISPRGMLAPWAWEHHRWQKSFANQFVHPGALEGAHGWHATSAAEADEIRTRGFRQPVCVAPNGVNAPENQAIERARAHWLSVCPEAGRRPTALFYSRLHEKKRVRELIALWIAKAPREWLLLIVGIPEGYTVEELNRLADASGAGDRIRVFDGTGAPAPYGVASLFLLPSHNENFGLVVAEALAHGLPAVVTDTTPWSGLNSAGRGWCVPWDQFGPAMLAALAEGPDRLRTRGAAARTWAIAEYSWEKSARTLADFYTELRR